MTVYLIGGAEVDELGQIRSLFGILDNIFLREGYSQILHIPFGKPDSLPPNQQIWKKWFSKNKLRGKYEFLSANSKEDLLRVNKPLVFISGGSNHKNLYDLIENNSLLVRLVKSANCLIGECSGAMVLGTYFRSSGENKSALIRGLNLIPGTIIEPHYSSRNRKDLIVKEVKTANVKYGIALDSLRGIRFDLNEFPTIQEHFGEGKFIFYKNEEVGQ